MPSNVLDSVLFRDSFGTPEMRAIFDDHELIRKYVEVEIALAQARGKMALSHKKPPMRSRKNALRIRWILISCAMKPKLSVTPFCRWCTKFLNRQASQAATSIGERPLRTLWIPPSSCRFAMHSTLSKAN